MAVIEIFVWTALIVCILVISKVAFGINLGGATLVERIATQTARLVVSVAAVLLWLVSWKKITELYFWRAIERLSKAN